jgi:hypothetical protein
VLALFVSSRIGSRSGIAMLDYLIPSIRASMAVPGSNIDKTTNKLSNSSP